MWQRNKDLDVVEREESRLAVQHAFVPVLINLIGQGDDVALAEAQLSLVLRLEVVQRLTARLLRGWRTSTRRNCKDEASFRSSHFNPYAYHHIYCGSHLLCVCKWKVSIEPHHCKRHREWWQVESLTINYNTLRHHVPVWLPSFCLSPVTSHTSAEESRALHTRQTRLFCCQTIFSLYQVHPTRCWVS